MKFWYQWHDTHASFLVQVDWHRLLVPENWSVCMALYTRSCHLRVAYLMSEQRAILARKRLLYQRTKLINKLFHFFNHSSPGTATSASTPTSTPVAHATGGMALEPDGPDFQAQYKTLFGRLRFLQVLSTRIHFSCPVHAHFTDRSLRQSNEMRQLNSQKFDLSYGNFVPCTILTYWGLCDQLRFLAVSI